MGVARRVGGPTLGAACAAADCADLGTAFVDEGSSRCRHGDGAGPAAEAPVRSRVHARAGELSRAQEVLMGVAEDDSAPTSMRAAAYSQLVAIVGPRLDDWEKANDLHKDWVRVRPGDTRASAFAPVIANRLARQRAK